MPLILRLRKEPRVQPPSPETDRLWRHLLYGCSSSTGDQTGGLQSIATHLITAPPSFSENGLPKEETGVGHSVVNKSALRSAGIMLSRVRATYRRSGMTWFESQRSHCCGAA
ncbi:hypothetical protein PoB_001892900 [Plakobranchus ocellatus]|uniref:Uncharacterized protein n=1 Tax=Plakobranchus ocellatus TaxID=259542 RepID=A0AAV3ZEX4_9GAST|nr:hypothetical protein PoB_001892900 [Plakobranchus ocellatus]